ncbi:Uncharacterised protein [Escherichia coli]|nr:hypothetical protein [Escherichia coli]STG42836.1 Uncharacterised protein [Escherichia coli]
MGTRVLAVGRAWQQLTDGEENMIFTFSGVIELCDSDIRPGESALSLRYPGQTIIISPPTKAWVRAAGYDNTVRLFISDRVAASVPVIKNRVGQKGPEALWQPEK